ASLLHWCLRCEQADPGPSVESTAEECPPAARRRQCAFRPERWRHCGFRACHRKRAAPEMKTGAVEPPQEPYRARSTTASLERRTRYPLPARSSGASKSLSLEPPQEPYRARSTTASLERRTRYPLPARSSGASKSLSLEP